MNFKFLNFKPFRALLLFTFYFLLSNSVSADSLNQSAAFYINPDYEYFGRDKITATLREISGNAYWYVSDDYWAGISEAEKSPFLSNLDELTREFDSRIYPVETDFWGSEPRPGIDNDPKITILISRLVDFAGGYFDSSHLYKKSQIDDSNEREMVFINSSSVISGRAKIFLAHEFQHLLAFYQKEILRDSSEETWLNEARAEYAPRQLGYDDIYETSNVRRRVFAFEQNPSDPLAEWKNQSSDYGAVTLFMYYLVDQYGNRILSDTLRSGKSGIESINEYLLLNGFTERFSNVFSYWTITNVLNDPAVNSRFAYISQHLKDFKIPPNQSYAVSGVGTVVSVRNLVSDWQPTWYEFSTPVNSGPGLNLKIDFSSDLGTKFHVPYIGFKINGEKKVGTMPMGFLESPQFEGSDGAMFLKNFGTDFYKVILIPANHSKISDFTGNDPSSSFNLKVQLTAEYQEAAPFPTPSPTPSAPGQLSIQSLIEQVSALQNQIAQLKEKTIQSAQAPKNLPPPTGALNRDLFIGSQGSDVRWLQEFLISQGVYPEARITGYFGMLTKNAVIRFQQKYAIFPQIGYVGIKTRAKIQELGK